MAIFAMADLHLAISNPEKSMEVFGKNWGDYIPRIKESFDAKVKPEDTVLMPGDLSWATYLNEAKEDFSSHGVIVPENVEAQVETSVRMGERPNLNDDELFITAQQLSRSEFGRDSVKELSLQRRKELGILLKHKWGASNGQIARIAQLDQRTVDEMFPMTAKRRL